MLHPSNVKLVLQISIYIFYKTYPYHTAFLYEMVY